MANYADSTRTPRTLTEREQRALLKATGEHRAGYRDHVLYAIALGTGLREHELIGLDVGYVFRDRRTRRRLLLSVFMGAGKADGTQEVLLSESLRGKLRRFHQWKDRERECLDDSAPLFVSRLGRRLSLRQVHHGFTVWQDRAGIRATGHVPYASPLGRDQSVRADHGHPAPAALRPASQPGHDHGLHAPERG